MNNIKETLNSRENAINKFDSKVYLMDSSFEEDLLLCLDCNIVDKEKIVWGKDGVAESFECHDVGRCYIRWNRATREREILSKDMEMIERIRYKEGEEPTKDKKGIAEFCEYFDGLKRVQKELTPDGGVIVDKYYEGHKTCHASLNEKGQWDGEVRTWYPNGNEERRTSYKDGKKHGMNYSFYKEGYLHSRTEYNMDKPVGVTESYDPFGLRTVFLNERVHDSWLSVEERLRKESELKKEGEARLSRDKISVSPPPGINVKGYRGCR